MKHSLSFFSSFCVLVYLASTSTAFAFVPKKLRSWIPPTLKLVATKFPKCTSQNDYALSQEAPDFDFISTIVTHTIFERLYPTVRITPLKDKYTQSPLFKLIQLQAPLLQNEKLKKHFLDLKVEEDQISEDTILGKKFRDWLTLRTGEAFEMECGPCYLHRTQRIQNDISPKLGHFPTKEEVGRYIDDTRMPIQGEIKGGMLKPNDFTHLLQAGGKPVLEIGPGTVPLIIDNEDQTYISIDPDVLEKIEILLKVRQVKSSLLIHDDFYTGQFESSHLNKYQVIVMRNFCWPMDGLSISKILQKVVTFLKPGGMLFIVEPLRLNQHTAKLPVFPYAQSIVQRSWRSTLFAFGKDFLNMEPRVFVIEQGDSSKLLGLILNDMRG